MFPRAWSTSAYLPSGVEYQCLCSLGHGVLLPTFRQRPLEMSRQVVGEPPVLPTCGVREDMATDGLETGAMVAGAVAEVCVVEPRLEARGVGVAVDLPGRLARGRLGVRRPGGSKSSWRMSTMCWKFINVRLNRAWLSTDRGQPASGRHLSRRDRRRYGRCSFRRHIRPDGGARTRRRPGRSRARPAPASRGGRRSGSPRRRER